MRNFIQEKIKIRLTLKNCFWLLVPVLVWNLVFASGLRQAGFQTDTGVPSWVLVAETILRILVFAFPIFLPLVIKERVGMAGLAVYLAGLLVYFISWIPLLYYPDSAWSSSLVGVLAPAYTPLILFLGIAMIGRSWAYALMAVLFSIVHVYHNVLNFSYLT